MVNPPSDTHLVTEAWLLCGLAQSLPGRLHLERQMLSFTHDSGELLFHAPLRDVQQVVFPWYYFGGGCQLTVDGIRHRFSFVRPNDADDAMDRLAAGAGDAGAVHAQVAGKFMDISTGRAAGRVWKEALR